MSVTISQILFLKGKGKHHGQYIKGFSLKDMNI